MPQTPLLISSKQKSVEDLPRSIAMSSEEDRTPDILPVPSKSAAGKHLESHLRTADILHTYSSSDFTRFLSTGSFVNSLATYPLTHAITNHGCKGVIDLFTTNIFLTSFTYFMVQDSYGLSP